MKIAVVGGGISGLTCAFWLQKLGHHVTIFEKKATLGGWVQSIKTPLGSIVDVAANGWLDNEPAVHELIEALEAQEEHIAVQDPKSTRWIVHRDRMVPAPLSPPMILKTPLLSFFSKIRLLWEPFVRSKSHKNESLADFIKRRLGHGVVDGLLTPMVAGIYAAHPSELDVRACFPKLVEWEKTYGSLFQALRSPNRPKEKPPVLHSFKNGAGSICERIAQTFDPSHIRFAEVTNIKREHDRWKVHNTESILEVDHVVLACPAFVQSRLLQNIDSHIAAYLDQILYSDVAVVVSEYPQHAWKNRHRGFGALCSQDQDLFGVLGILFTSDIFPSRSPNSHLLTRSILGGTRYPDVLQWSEKEIQQRVFEAHQKLFGKTEHQALEVHVWKHKNAIPRYALGHDERQREIQRHIDQKHPHLSLLGNHLFGVGVKDCIRNGRDCAYKIHKGQILSNPS